MSAPSSPVIPDMFINTRTGLSLTGVADSLGPLTDLAGTWIGNGFTLISLLDFDPAPPSTGPRPFRLKLNTTVEVLEFTPIGGAVPNRGSTGQLDINIFGLRYLLRNADVVTNQPLHIEPGFWLNVPPTTVPAGGATVVCQGTISHGNSMLALGTSLTVPSGPQIDAVDSTSIKNPATSSPLGSGYLAPFDDPPLPPGFKLPFVKNLNLALEGGMTSKETLCQRAMGLRFVAGRPPRCCATPRETKSWFMTEPMNSTPSGCSAPRQGWPPSASAAVTRSP